MTEAMTAPAIQWPVKTREIDDAYFDSRRWNDFPFRDDDVIVATYAKVGTTWTQQIVWQLLHGAPPGVEGSEIAPWLDWRIRPFQPMLDQLQAQTHRRCIKSHLPLDALVFSHKAKYLVVGRDARDMVWSAYNHQDAYTDEILEQFNSPAGRPGAPVFRPDCDIRDYYLHFLDHDELRGFGFVPFWPHIQGWWNARRLPNVLLLHHAAMKADLPGEIRRIAAFLEVGVDEAIFPAIVEHCSFDYMRDMAGDGLSGGFRGGAKTFFNKGTNGRWKDVLTPAEIARCDEVAARNLTPDCARWLATGELPDRGGA
ncbi:MAG: sulfotransferase domain-containing protein [Caulobacterales bacterium]